MKRHEVANMSDALFLDSFQRPAASDGTWWVGRRNRYFRRDARRVRRSDAGTMKLPPIVRIASFSLAALAATQFTNERTGPSVTYVIGRYLRRRRVQCNSC